MNKCQPKALTPYLDGELAPESRQQVEEHLRSCAPCGALLDEVTSARERVRGMGRSLIPGTTLMPAMAVFGERSGIGETRGLDPGDIPEPAAATPPVATDPVPLETTVLADDVTPDAEVPLDEPDIYNEERFRAVLTVDPIVTAPPEPEVEEEEQVTWVDIPARVVPSPPPLQPAPWMGASAAADGPRAMEDVPNERAPVFEPPLILEPPPVPERSIQAEPRGEPGPFSAIVRPAVDAEGESVEDPEPEVPELAGPLPWEQEMPKPETNATLEERPDAPAPQPVPPWVAAETADAEDIEARGRRLVEEELAAQVAVEREAGGERHPVPARTVHHEPDLADEAPAVLAPGFAPEPDDEVAAAVAGMREELTGPHDEAEPALVAVADEPPAGGMPALDRQVKVGAGVAAAILVLVLAAVLVLPRLGTHRTSPVASIPTGNATPAGIATPGASPSPAAGSGATPATSAPPGIPQLSGMVTRGSGGTGYNVQRIRAASPGAGIYRIVFDLAGTGPSADAHLGRASDGSLYLQATGITIDPAIIAAFKPIGPISGMGSAGASGGLGLRLASSQAQSPQYSMYYLTGPNRLVIDLK